MKVVLELLQQSSNIKRVTVRHDIVIGRGSDCNLRISAPQVSRRHCFLRIDNNTVAITDLESCNGTWLDGQRTVPGKRYFIEDGMQVAVGPVRFRACISDDLSDSNQPEENLTHMDPAPAPARAKAPVKDAAAPAAAAMDFAIEHAGDASEEDEPTVDYTSQQAEEPAEEFIDPGEIEIVGGQSEEVILLDDATEVVDGGISVEAIDVMIAVEITDDDKDLIDDADIDDAELLVAEEVFDDDASEELLDFLEDEEY